MCGPADKTSGPESEAMPNDWGKERGLCVQVEKGPEKQGSG